MSIQPLSGELYTSFFGETNGNQRTDSHFNLIPNDIVFQIFCETKGKDFKRLALVDRRFNNLLSHPCFEQLWKNCFRCYTNQEIRNIETNLYQSNFVCNKFPYVMGILSFKVRDGLLARANYVKKIDVINLRNGSIKLDIDPYNNSYMFSGTGYPCLQLIDRKLFLGNYSGDVEVIDLDSQQEIARYKGFPCEASGKPICFQVVNEKLFSGSCADKKIKMWDLNSGHIEKTFGEWGLVEQKNFCLQVNNKHVFFTSNNLGLVEKWDIESGKKVGTFEHGASVSCLQLTDDYLISGGYSDKETVKIWDHNSGECLKILSHGYHVNSIFATDRRLFTGGLNGNIMMWDIRSGTGILIATDMGVIDQMQFVEGALVVNGSLVLEFNISEQESDQINFDKIREIANRFLTGGVGFWNLYYRGDFHCLPRKHKNKIFEELYFVKTPEYFNSLFKNYDSCGEDAFLERNGLSANIIERGNAILSYLRKMNHQG